MIKEPKTMDELLEQTRPVTKGNRIRGKSSRARKHIEDYSTMFIEPMHMMEVADNTKFREMISPTMAGIISDNIQHSAAQASIQRQLAAQGMAAQQPALGLGAFAECMYSGLAGQVAGSAFGSGAAISALSGFDYSDWSAVFGGGGK